MSLPRIDTGSLFDVAGKSAIIVGATGSFGKVVCATLGKSGARLVVTAGSKDGLATLTAELAEAGIEAVPVNRRPNTETDCDAIVAAAVEAYGSVDILVIASGMNDVSPIVDMAPDRFQKVMTANVDGAWLMARAAGKRMIEQGRGGKVVFTSSARGKLGHPAGYSAYCTSKSAIDGMTKALGCEWGKYGITVNAIAPTVFRSPVTAWMFEDNDNATNVRNGFLARVPIGRLGEPEDLAGPLLFLCSRASDFHTGHIVYADGGYTAG
ncbi:short-chain dehydrogenase/reductase SDR (plasmid) [Rhizorhabdus wittichii RW1]|jgi:NAD(P)-dependent dehydrogenase (short-subunit alcohol dehydrogenase family)|uniref:Short-chain dehydrogenase/reductase SDR n=1 Tax=Rhizorhabdus wittichii (strain DSM 6014 / CCUG 31198 / JCM 15750 / NBRC 105917 / EY 4224 / RW1) TaxID=392499 RepID=A0A9J9HHB3_RHIWR|nr:SDR family oxidoreductase [Sphingobium sp. LB126]ABQ71669.1 short-chain dehydrogenase/reductase SDR [Rhizorhabdus wittichii RW1]PJG45545.1 oxidoreductase [Sphingobium sp. LB126]